MANTKPSAFPTKTTAYADTKLISQLPGNSGAAEDCQFSLATIRDFIAPNGVMPGSVASASLASGSVGSVAIPANSLVTHIVITSTGAGTVDIGTSSGGVQIADDEPYINGSKVVMLGEVFTSSGNLYFATHSHTLTVKIIIISIA